MLFARLQQVQELRKHAEHLAFFLLADKLKEIEIELYYRLGIRNYGENYISERKHNTREAV